MFSIALLVASIIFPLLIAVLICKFYKRLSDPAVSDKISSLYEGLKTHSKAALAYNSVFVVRRFLFALTIVLLYEHPGAQIQFLILYSVLMIIYDVLVKPFEDPNLNKLEIFNELCILVTGYHLICFSDFVP